MNIGEILSEATGEIVRNYRDLKVFKKARELAAITMRVTSGFPRSDRSNLSAQMRNAASSISANIAEGYRKFSTREYIRYLKIAYGSCAELESRSLIVHDAGWISEPDYLRMVELQDAISRMLWKMIQSLQRRLESQKNRPQRTSAES
jgi:four helix bundle protein